MSGLFGNEWYFALSALERSFLPVTWAVGPGFCISHLRCLAHRTGKILSADLVAEAP